MGALGGHTFTAEHYGQIPELSHVEGFEDLTLIGCTIAVKAEGSVRLSGVLLSKGKTSADRNLSANDPVTSEKAF